MSSPLPPSVATLPSDLKSDIERHTKHILEIFNFYCEYGICHFI